MRMKLKTPILFKTLEELKETVSLGLEEKERYLDGVLKTPMIQGINHNKHSPISKLGSCSLIHIKDVQRWPKVRVEYIEKDSTKKEAIQWEPKAGEWVVDLEGDSTRNSLKEGTKRFGLERGTCKEAEKASSQMKAHNRLLAYVAEFDKGWEADWTDNKQEKAYIDVIKYSKETQYGFSCVYLRKQLGAVYMSKECAEDLAEKLNYGEVTL
jgi:hypothetical protein